MEITEAVRKKIPPEIRLCYWDYYHDNIAFYEKNIQLHRELSSNPLVASGVWTWGSFWCNLNQVFKAALPCIQACRQTGISELFFTMWGDNGGFCLYDSALAGLELCSGVAYGEMGEDDLLYSQRFHAICDEDYNLYKTTAQLLGCYAEKILWDDPLQGNILLTCEYNNMLTNYSKNLTALTRELNLQNKLSAPLEVIRLLAAVLLDKINLRQELLLAYSQKDYNALWILAEERIAPILYRLEKFDDAFRADWLNSAKPFGLEVIQRRNAGVAVRYRELRRVLLDYLNGTLSGIAELDASLQAASDIQRKDFLPDNIYSGSCYL